MGCSFAILWHALPAVARYLLGALEDTAFLDLRMQEDAGGTSTATGLVVFQHAEKELYQRLVDAARNRLGELELEYRIEKLKGIVE